MLKHVNYNEKLNKIFISRGKEGQKKTIERLKVWVIHRLIVGDSLSRNTSHKTGKVLKKNQKFEGSF